jgi:hypothetical protein
MAQDQQSQSVGNGIQEAGTRIMNGGRLTGLPPHMIGAQESPNCTDVDPVYPWGAKTRPGSAFVASLALGSGSPISGLSAIVMNKGSQYLYAGNATTIYVYDVAAATMNSIGIGMATDSIMQAVILNNEVVVVASGLALRYSSTGTTALTAIPAGTYLPSFAKYVTLYVSKAWYAGDPGFPSRTTFTASQDPLDTTTANNAGFIDIGTGDGDVVQGLEGTKNCVYIFKRKNTYAVTGTSVFDFSATLLCRWGLVSPYAHCTDGQGCFFAADDGIYYAVGLNVARLSDSVKVDYDSISDKSTIAMEVVGEKLFVFFKGPGATANNKALVCAYKRQLDNGQVHGVWSLYNSQPFQVANTSRLGNIYAGTVGSTPQIYQLDTGSSTVGFTWNTPDEDYGDLGYKQLIRYFVHCQPGSSATYTITAQPFADGASIGNAQTRDVPPTGSIASGANVGSHYALMFLPDTNIRGRFIRIQLTATGNNVITGYRLYCDVRSEGMPRA